MGSASLGESSRQTLARALHPLAFCIATPVVRILHLDPAALVSAVRDAAAHDHFGIDPLRSAVLITCDPISVWVEAMRVLTDNPDLSSNSQRSKIVAVQVRRR